MRLWGTNSLSMRDFPTGVPNDLSYAVLSHTWDTDECLYEDLMKSALLSDKFKSFRRVAYELGCEYCWSDAWCIDRKSTAAASEKNEVVASVYAWFHRARVSCVYLKDVEGAEFFDKAKWFTRSWALVELLAPAPEAMHFYDRDWRHLGTKQTLAAKICAITNVPVDILLHRRDPLNATVGEKLSWASSKSASLPEEVIYALISLLKVNMDMRPGEGKDVATVRMQEQILGNLEDYTVLMWGKPFGLANRKQLQKSEEGMEVDDVEKTMEEYPQWDQLILHSPIDLVSAEEIGPHLPHFQRPPESPQLTSRGLRVSLFAKHVRSFMIAWTYCTQRRNGKLYAVCIRVVGASDFRHAKHDYLRGATSGRVCYVAIDRLRSFELKDIYFSVEVI